MTLDPHSRLHGFLEARAAVEALKANWESNALWSGKDTDCLDRALAAIDDMRASQNGKTSHRARR